MLYKIETSDGLCFYTEDAGQASALYDSLAEKEAATKWRAPVQWEVEHATKASQGVD